MEATGSDPDLFAAVKERVDIKDAARAYGLRPVRGGWYCCPFHHEKTPSFHFRGQRFHCFGCGAGGDVLDLVGRLLDLAPLEAAKELKRAFGLGMDMDAPVDAQALAGVREAQRKREAFKAWREEVRAVLARRFSALYQMRKGLTPASMDELTEEYAAALRELDVLEYYLDLANSRDEAELREAREVLDQVVQKVREHGELCPGRGAL